MSHINSNNSNGNSGILFEPVAPASQSNQKVPVVVDRDIVNRNESEATLNQFATTSHNSNMNNMNNTQDAQSNTSLNTINCSEEVECCTEKGIDEEIKDSIKQSNLQARRIIFQDIRRPGRDYSQLLEHLSLIKGNLETKLQFIQMCIEESQRFRRKKMADCIQEWWDKYVDRTNNFNSIGFAT